MKRSFVSRLAIVSVVVCLLAVMIVFPVACDDTPKVEKKAIIILPGIMGSNIVDGATGDPLWAPIKRGLDLWDPDAITNLLTDLPPEVNELLDLDGPKGGLAWIDKMKIKPDGIPNYTYNEPQSLDVNGVAKFDKVSMYGTADYYKRPYLHLKEKYGDKYDVRLFEYDWRLDNSVNAEKLENFIAENEYDKVVLIGHSMGGVLSSTFLARSEKNREMTEKFISCGAPFFGAHKALRVMENPLSMVGDDMDGVLKMAKRLINSMNPEMEDPFDEFFGAFMQFAYDLPTIYQLMPYVDMMGGYTDELANTYPELKDINIINIDGKAIKTYDEFVTFMNGRGYNINKRCLDNMVKWQDEQYVEVDGKKTHASMLVDTAYLVGINKDTEVAVNFENGEMKNCTMSKFGDGTVPAYSALCGLPVTDERVKTFDEISHGNLLYDEPCLEYIDTIIDGLIAEA